jgi:hypothetical protein
MSDNLPPATAPPVEDIILNTVTNVSGGVNITTQGGIVTFRGPIVGRGYYSGVFMGSKAYVTVPPEYLDKISEFIHQQPDGSHTIDTDSLKKLDELGIPWKIEDGGFIVDLLAELGAKELARRKKDAEIS